MFSRKKDDEEDNKAESGGKPAAGLAASSGSEREPLTSRSTPSRPEVVRRAPDIHGSRQLRGERGLSGEGKTLVVGREIALNGEINSCDKLVVEGRVEANMTDCREIEVAEGGTFKGQAEIDIAEISGVFEGSLTAREILVVRSTGRITGTVRFGQLEIERGGEVVGDLQLYTPDEGATVTAAFTAESPAE